MYWSIYWLYNTIKCLHGTRGNKRYHRIYSWRAGKKSDTINDIFSSLINTLRHILGYWQSIFRISPLKKNIFLIYQIIQFVTVESVNHIIDLNTVHLCHQSKKKVDDPEHPEETKTHIRNMFEKIADSSCCVARWTVLPTPHPIPKHTHTRFAQELGINICIC